MSSAVVGFPHSDQAYNFKIERSVVQIFQIKLCVRALVMNEMLETPVPSSRCVESTHNCLRHKRAVAICECVESTHSPYPESIDSDAPNLRWGNPIQVTASRSFYGSRDDVKSAI